MLTPNGVALAPLAWLIDPGCHRPTEVRRPLRPRGGADPRAGQSVTCPRYGGPPWGASGETGPRCLRDEVSSLLRTLLLGRAAVFSAGLGLLGCGAGALPAS